MTWLLLNIPLMVLFFALWVGVPVWLVRKRPDRKPALAAAPRRPDSAGQHWAGAALPGGRRLPPGRLGEPIRPVRAGTGCTGLRPAACPAGGREKLPGCWR